VGGSERRGTGLCSLPGGLTRANSIQKEQLIPGDGTVDLEGRNSRPLWLGSQLSRVISWIFSNLTCDSSLTYTGVWLSSEPGQGAADSREQPSHYFHLIPILISWGPIHSLVERVEGDYFSMHGGPPLGPHRLLFPKPELGRHPPPLGLFGNVSPLCATQRWREQPVQARWHLGEVPAPRGKDREMEGLVRGEGGMVYGRGSIQRGEEGAAG